MLTKNKTDISFLNDNKKDSNYLYERLKKLKKQNNNVQNKHLYDISFKKIHKLKGNNSDPRILYNLLSQSNSKNDNMKMNLTYLKNNRLSNFNPSERSSNISNIENFNLINNSINYNKNILPDINNSKSKDINNSFKGIFNSSNFSIASKSTSRSKFIIKEINLNNASYSERTNNTSNLSKFSFQRKNKVSNLRKLIFNKNKINSNLNKNLQKKYNNLNNLKKYDVSQKNSLSVKVLSSDYLPSIIENENKNLIKMHGIDLEIKDLVEKKKTKNNNLKEENKEKFDLHETAKFFDFLPSLIMKKNYEKNEKKMDNLYNNYINTINNKLENEKKDIKNSFNIPIIKYLFLQNLLNNFTHKVDFMTSSFIKQNDILIKYANNEEELNKQIKDFITYGYEYIPEKYLKINNYKENINNKAFINIISKSNNYIKNNQINNSFNKQINIKGEGLGDLSNEITSKCLFNNINSNLMLKFLKKNYKKTIKNIKTIKTIKTQNKSTMMDIPSLGIDNIDHTNAYILNEIKKILYNNINKINNIENEKENEKITKKKELLWNKILNQPMEGKNTKSDNICFVKKKTRKIKTPKNTIKTNRNTTFYIKKKKKRIKSGRLYIESGTMINSKTKKEKKEKQENEKNLLKNIIKKDKNIKNGSIQKTFSKNIYKINNIFNNNIIK